MEPLAPARTRGNALDRKQKNKGEKKMTGEVKKPPNQGRGKGSKKRQEPTSRIGSIRPRGGGGGGDRPEKKARVPPGKKVKSPDRGGPAGMGCKPDGKMCLIKKFNGKKNGSTRIEQRESTEVETKKRT